MSLGDAAGRWGESFNAVEVKVELDHKAIVDAQRRAIAKSHHEKAKKARMRHPHGGWIILAGFALTVALDPQIPAGIRALDAFWGLMCVLYAFRGRR